MCYDHFSARSLLAKLGRPLDYGAQLQYIHEWTILIIIIIIIIYSIIVLIHEVIVLGALYMYCPDFDHTNTHLNSTRSIQHMQPYLALITNCKHSQPVMSGTQLWLSEPIPNDSGDEARTRNLMITSPASKPLRHHSWITCLCPTRLTLMSLSVPIITMVSFCDIVGMANNG